MITKTEITYVGCFLTLECNLNCAYCINNFHDGPLPRYELMDGKSWVKAINMLELRDDLPVTLQGGEPSLHPDFIWILNNIRTETHIDILTNLTFDISRFISSVDPRRLNRQAPYASIRVSYHPKKTSFEELSKKVLRLTDAGFNVGIYGILYPEDEQEILEVKNKCADTGLDFRTKEFLGKHNGKLYGTYKYPQALSGKKGKPCMCTTSELLIAPDGSIRRCHHDLYNKTGAAGNILDEDFAFESEYMSCDNFGSCNPCDVKVKTDRFQVHGYTAVNIKTDD